jgi:NAD(P)-dependent dehydrogenase (short-subunit alcohol dehydrogenase family)
MALYGRFRRPGPSGFSWNSTTAEVTGDRRLDGTTWLLTGCTAGIGRATLDAMRRVGAEVWGTSRSAQRAADAGARGLACDLGDAASVDAAIAAVRRGPRLSGIVANAGVYFAGHAPPVGGRDHQLMVNHVGHARLVLGLLDHLTEDAQVVVVSSNAHHTVRAGALEARWETPGGGSRAYATSKLANAVFARELARRLPAGQRAVALHPGSVHTDIARSLPAPLQVGFGLLQPVFFKTADQGAATTLYGVLHDVPNGAWLQDGNVGRASALAEDTALGRWLWDATAALNAAGW